MSRFLYIVYNKECLIKQTVYSVLSLLDEAQGDNIIITIITNFSKDRFSGISFNNKVRFDVIDDIDDINKSWALNGYVYNIKIIGLKYYFEKYKENVLFIDSDTIMMKDPVPLYCEIGPAVCYLNSKYCRLMELFDLKYEADARRAVDLDELDKSISFFNSFKDSGNTLFDEITSDFVYYNSGIIGLAYENRHLLNEIYRLCNDIWEKYHFVMSEEFAFSYVLQKAGIEIRETDDLVIHYNALKWVRLLAALTQKKYVGNDDKLAEQFLSVLKMKDSNSMELKKEDIVYLVSYILKSINLSEWKLGYVEIAYDRILIQKYRKFLSMFEEYSENEKDNIYHYLLSFIDEK